MAGLVLHRQHFRHHVDGFGLGKWTDGQSRADDPGCVSGSGVVANTKVIAQLTGVTGKAGTYSLTGSSQTVASAAMVGVSRRSNYDGVNALVNFDGTNVDGISAK
jgi:hypothetical protein